MCKNATGSIIDCLPVALPMNYFTHRVLPAKLLHQKKFHRKGQIQSFMKVSLTYFLYHLIRYIQVSIQMIFDRDCFAENNSLDLSDGVLCVSCVMHYNSVENGEPLTLKASALSVSAQQQQLTSLRKWGCPTISFHIRRAI